MKKFTGEVALLILLAFTFTGCGVMFGGSRYNASIIAKDHPNAEIFVNGKNIGKGKARRVCMRALPLTVELKEAGCENTKQTFENSFRTGNFILSVISWGLIGVAIDLGTGAAYKPDHKHDPSIKRMNDKDYVFTVDYSGCPVKMVENNSGH